MSLGVKIWRVNGSRHSISLSIVITGGSEVIIFVARVCSPAAYHNGLNQGDQPCARSPDDRTVCTKYLRFFQVAGGERLNKW